jgi:hypothetical protein
MSRAVNETGLVHAIGKAVKKHYPGALIYKIHGGPMQETGIPDLLICIQGLFIGAEVKHQKPGESEQHARDRATPSQRMQIMRINAAGGMAGVVLSVEETLDLIRRAFEKQESVRAERLLSGPSEGDRTT